MSGPYDLPGQHGERSGHAIRLLRRRVKDLEERVAAWEEAYDKGYSDGWTDGHNDRAPSPTSETPDP